MYCGDICTVYNNLTVLITEFTCWCGVCNTSVLQVVMGYQVPKTYHMASPLRSRSVKRLARGSYHIVMKDFATSVLHQKIMGLVSWHEVPKSK